MKIYIGGDHAGYELKEKLKEYLGELAKSKISSEIFDRTNPKDFSGYEVEDKGAFELNPKDDYPDYIKLVVEAVVEGPEQNERRMGIVLGGSGQGEAMDANRLVGVRACEFYGGNLDVVKVCREHNDANILSLGARFVTEEEAKWAVKIFLETPFSGNERHIRRINKIDELGASS